MGTPSLTIARHLEMLELVDGLTSRHPELGRQVRWPDVLAIADREGIDVDVLRLPRPGRILRYLGEYSIQISDRLSLVDRAFFGMHELVHFWCDFEEGSREYPEDARREAFADMVANYVTAADRTVQLAAGGVWAGAVTAPHPPEACAPRQPGS